MSGILMVLALISPTIAVLGIEVMVRRRLRSTRYEREVDE